MWARKLWDCFENGIGTELNVTEANKYYKPAAEVGDFDALADYAINMVYGAGVEKNEQAGYDTFSIAASAGSIVGLEYLGDWHRYGLGVKQDYEVAFRL